MFITVLCDDRRYSISTGTIAKYPDSVLNKAISLGMDMDKNIAFYSHKEKTMYLDLCKESVDIIIDYVRGYNIDFSNIKLSVIESVCRDAELLGFNDLTDDLQDYLPVYGKFIDWDSTIESLVSTIVCIKNNLLEHKLINDGYHIHICNIAAKYLMSKDFRELIDTIMIDKSKTYREFHMMSLYVNNFMAILILFLEQISQNVMKGMTDQIDKLVSFVKENSGFAIGDGIDNDDIASKMDRINTLRNVIGGIGSAITSMVNE